MRRDGGETVMATACQPVISTPTDIPARSAPPSGRSPSTVGIVRRVPRGWSPRSAAYHRIVPLRAVITDWGGVLTPPIPQLVRAWADADHINWDAYITAEGPWLSAAYDTNAPSYPVHALERVECNPAD